MPAQWKRPCRAGDRALERMLPMNINELLDNPVRRDALIADSATLVEQEVSDKSGLSGMAVKAMFGVVTKLKPGILQDVLQNLIPRFAEALGPILERKPEGVGVGAWIQQNSNDVVQALLGVTDARAAKTEHGALRSSYEKLRPTGEKHVAAAIPRLAKLFDKHLQ